VVVHCIDDEACSAARTDIMKKATKLGVCKDGKFVATKSRNLTEYYRTGLLDDGKSSTKACLAVRKACQCVQQILFNKYKVKQSRIRKSLLRPGTPDEKSGLAPHIDRDAFGSSTYGFDDD